MRSNSLLLITIIFVRLISLHAFQYSDFDCYQSRLTCQQLETKLPYLGQQDVIDDHVVITNDRMFVYASRAHQQAHQPEFVLRLAVQPAVVQPLFNPRLGTTKPLRGFRVAIDPGHLGGNMAIIEERFVDLAFGVGVDGKPLRYQFNEGTLALATAKLIQRLLQEQGATVMLTRQRLGKAVYHQTFEAWCAQALGIKHQSAWYTMAGQQKVIDFLKAQDLAPFQQRDLVTRLLRVEECSRACKGLLLQQTVFRLCYNQLDLRARAKKINSFKPHITLIIHFNAEGSGTTPVDANYNMTFVPGSFLAGELEKSRNRYELVRLLVTEDLTASIQLSEAITNQMTQTLALPLMGEGYSFSDNVICVEPGVFCRNLLLTRCIHGPLCYGETFIQNNREEAQRLAKTDLNVDGIVTSSRIADVAHTYFLGICRYVGLS